MTVANTSGRVEYAGNGVATTLPVTFPFFIASDLLVYKESTTTAAALQSVGVHYTVTGGGGGEGNVIMVAAPAVGETVRIIRAVPNTQGIDYVENGALQAATLEGGFDRATLQIQQIADSLSETLRVPVGEASLGRLASKLTRASTTLGFNSTGQLAYTPAGTLPVDYAVVATGSTAGRTLSERFSGVVNVRDFGAKGDGVTDDTAAVHAAISHAISINRSLYVPAGQYVLTAAYYLGADVPTMIFGDGYESCLLCRGTVDAGFLYRAKTNPQSAQMTISGLRLRGQADTTPVQVTNYGLTNMFKIDHVLFLGVYAEYSRGFSLGVGLGRQATVRECTVRNSLRDAVNITNFDAVMMQNNRIIGCGDDSLAAHMDAAGINPDSRARSMVLITGNTVIDSGGIKTKGGKGTKITSNMLWFAKGRGITTSGKDSTFGEGLTAGLGCTASDNTIMDVVDIRVVTGNQSLREGVRMGSESPSAGTGAFAIAGIPGFVTGGSYVDEQPYLYTAQTSSGDKRPIPPGMCNAIRANTIMRTMPATAIKPWIPATPYSIGDKCVSHDRIYTCTTSGTSVSSISIFDGPSGAGTGITDGTVVWEEDTATVPVRIADYAIWKHQPEYGDVTFWKASTAYTVGARVIAGRNMYVCTVAGTSSITMPTTVATIVIDGGVTWAATEVPAAWVASKAYAIGDKVLSNNALFMCKISGTSGSTPPNGYDQNIVDGGVTWQAYSLVPGTWTNSGWQNPIVTETDMSIRAVVLDRALRDCVIENNIIYRVDTGVFLVAEKDYGNGFFDNIKITGNIFSDFSSTALAITSGESSWVASRAYGVGALVTADTLTVVGDPYAGGGTSEGLYECITAGTSGSTFPGGTGSSITDGTALWKYLRPAGRECRVYFERNAINGDPRFVSAGRASGGGWNGIAAPNGVNTRNFYGLWVGGNSFLNVYRPYNRGNASDRMHFAGVPDAVFGKFYDLNDFSRNKGVGIPGAHSPFQTVHIPMGSDPTKANYGICPIEVAFQRDTLPPENRSIALAEEPDAFYANGHLLQQGRLASGAYLYWAQVAGENRFGWIWYHWKSAGGGSLDVLDTGDAWATLTAYALNQRVWRKNGSLWQVYNCTTAGTSGASAPTGTGTGITDGTCVWAYLAPHRHLERNHNVGVGEYYWIDDGGVPRIYQVTGAGTTAASGGASGTGSSITDGTATFAYYANRAVWKQAGAIT